MNAMTDLSNLGDDCFILASHAISEIAHAAEKELGRRATLEELCELLAWGFRSCSDDVLADVNPGRVERVKCKLLPANREFLSPGDVVAIPSGDGKCYLGVYITRNRFGCAFGFFRGAWPCRPIRGCGVAKLDPLPPPIYTTMHSLWDGTWQLVGHVPELLARFSDEPELYHSKKDNPKNDAIGPFGAAEAPSGGLRLIDADEAARVGLLDGSYRQTVLHKNVGRTLGVRNRE
jgi:hypothetical protein